MKVSASKYNWEQAVQIAFLASGGNEESGIPGYFLIRFVDGGIELLGCNASRQVAGGPVIGASVVEGKDGDSFTVPARRFRDLLLLCKDEDEVLIEHDNGVSKATSPFGGSKWGSQDPKNFPLVDSTIKAAVLVGEVPSVRLVNILNYAKVFTSDQETRNPALVAMECRDGLLSATNSVGVAMITSPLLEKSTLRVHNKDVGVLTAFLSLKGSETVEILEHDFCLIVRRKDGRYCAVGRWMHELPSLKLKRDDPPKCSFSVPTADLALALKYLDVFCGEKDKHLRCRFKDDDLILRMASASGDSENVEKAVRCDAVDNLSLLSAAGHQEFVLSKGFVEILVKAFEGLPSIPFGINWTTVNGYVTVARQEGEDDYFTTIVWLKK